MSLSSFLLKGNTQAKIDKGLNDIFASTNAQAGPSTSTQPASTVPGPGERKRRFSVAEPSGKAKKSKAAARDVDSKVDEPLAVQKAKFAWKGKSQETSQPGASDEEEEPVGGPFKPSDLTKLHAEQANDDEAGCSDSDDEGDPSQMVHESLIKGGKTRSKGRSTKTKYVPPEETPERRNVRTMFIGNVPMDVAKSKSLLKQLKRHVLSFVPTAKIESVRFRSVAFQNPTSKLPVLDDADDKSKTKGAGKEKEEEGREHDRERAASWRAKKGQDEEEPTSKSYLTPKEKKRIAYIKHELHSGADAMNAYVVFAHPPPSSTIGATAQTPIMDSYEAAKLAAELCDGSVFMEHTLRADQVGKDAKIGDASTADPKTTIFIGNLDFASKEEDVRVFFEALVSAERGPPGERDEESSDEEGEDESEDERTRPQSDAKKPRTWVTRVRIIRDKDTQLGKGFAYVQFVDRECVDEILALEESRLKFAKRKLRVQRCKTVPGSAKVLPKYTKPSASTSAPPTKSLKSPALHRRTSTSANATPHGDHKLGQKISHLPKEERKKVKAADAARVARRLAKKKAKVLADKGVKARPDRERVRKRPGEKKDVGGAHKEKSKKRVRSGSAIAKMNTKK